ncbi:MAG: ParA family protein [Vicinamibacteria bacterium]
MEPPTARVIAIANRKGGVAKTTTTIHLGAALAQRGRRVLLVDLDAQQDLCAALRVAMPRPGLADTLLGIALFGSGNLASSFVRTDGVTVAGGYGIAEAERELSLHKNRENALKLALAPHLQSFDFVLMDCAPSIHCLTASALAAARDILIPIQTEFLAANQLPGIMCTIDDIRSRLNPGLKVAGFLPTMFDGRSRHALAVMERIAVQAHDWGVRAFKPIPRSVRFAEAAEAGQTISRHAPDSFAARAYEALADDIDRSCRARIELPAPSFPPRAEPRPPTLAVRP